MASANSMNYDIDLDIELFDVIVTSHEDDYNEACDFITQLRNKMAVDGPDPIIAHLSDISCHLRTINVIDGAIKNSTHLLVYVSERLSQYCTNMDDFVRIAFVTAEILQDKSVMPIWVNWKDTCKKPFGLHMKTGWCYNGREIEPRKWPVLKKMLTSKKEERLGKEGQRARYLLHISQLEDRKKEHLLKREKKLYSDELRQLDEQLSRLPVETSQRPDSLSREPTHHHHSGESYQPAPTNVTVINVNINQDQPRCEEQEINGRYKPESPTSVTDSNWTKESMSSTSQRTMCSTSSGGSANDITDPSDDGVGAATDQSMDLSTSGDSKGVQTVYQLEDTRACNERPVPKERGRGALNLQTTISNHEGSTQTSSHVERARNEKPIPSSRGSPAASSLSMTGSSERERRTIHDFPVTRANNERPVPRRRVSVESNRPTIRSSSERPPSPQLHPAVDVRLLTLQSNDLIPVPVMNQHQSATADDDPNSVAASVDNPAVSDDLHTSYADERTLPSQMDSEFGAVADPDEAQPLTLNPPATQSV